jgi:hypothetical protein
MKKLEEYKGEKHMSELEDLKFVNNWTKNLMDNLNEIRNKEIYTGAEIEQAIGECSKVCFLKNEFDKKLVGFENLEEYLKYCETDLGWEVDYNKETGVIMCYEHNEECLCPVVRCNENISDAMCCCTQGEIKRMFSYAIKQEVDVEIVHSFVRDGKSCVYKVTLR